MKMESRARRSTVAAGSDRARDRWTGAGWDREAGTGGAHRCRDSRRGGATTRRSPERAGAGHLRRREKVNEASTLEMGKKNGEEDQGNEEFTVKPKSTSVEAEEFERRRNNEFVAGLGEETRLLTSIPSSNQRFLRSRVFSVARRSS
jgi:hypothetical protein